MNRFLLRNYAQIAHCLVFPLHVLLSHFVTIGAIASAAILSIYLYGAVCHARSGGSQ
jgi:hypothetical protein